MSEDSKTGISSSTGLCLGDIHDMIDVTFDFLVHLMYICEEFDVQGQQLGHLILQFKLEHPILRDGQVGHQDTWHCCTAPVLQDMTK